MPTNNWGPFFPQSTYTITSTQNFLQNELQPESGQQGVPALTGRVTIDGTPSVQQDSWNTGAVGSQGNKSS